MFGLFREPSREPARKARPVPNVPQRFGFLELSSIIIVPWLVCVGICFMFAQVYHSAPGAVWLVILVGWVVCMYMLTNDIQKDYREHGVVDSSLAHLCLAAILLATISGVVAYRSYYSKYWLSHNSHSYVNVMPSEAATAYADAGKIIFSEDARVVVSKALGYKDGSVYCVAPIQDDADSKVQFFAAGLDCCGARGSFSCDDAWDSKARAGVVLQPEPGYLNAAHQAQAAFGLYAAQEPVFVRWVVDPERVELKNFLFGNGILVGVCLVFLVLLATFGTSLNLSQRTSYYAERIGFV